MRFVQRRNKRYDIRESTDPRIHRIKTLGPVQVAFPARGAGLQDKLHVHKIKTFHRRSIGNQFQVIRQLTSGHLSAVADSKTSPRNPAMCIVLLLENIASLGWILNCKFRPLNSQSLAAQSQCQN